MRQRLFAGYKDPRPAERMLDLVRSMDRGAGLASEK
jgi:hypothetical protein